MSRQDAAGAEACSGREVTESAAGERRARTFSHLTWWTELFVRPSQKTKSVLMSFFLFHRENRSKSVFLDGHIWPATFSHLALRILMNSEKYAHLVRVIDNVLAGPWERAKTPAPHSSPFEKQSDYSRTTSLGLSVKQKRRHLGLFSLVNYCIDS